MPARNIIKTYIEDGYYHVYNRGVEKRDIFMDETDCRVFLFYLKIYLSPVEEVADLFKSIKMSMARKNRLISNNLSTELDLLSFALMPNHFHLLLKQHTNTAMIKLMRRLSTSYVMYFNNKYQRIGSLFQNRYKASLATSDEYLLHLSRYIHLNPSELHTKINFKNYTSYPYYLGEKSARWLKPDEILSFFSTQTPGNNKQLTYKSFVETYQKEDEILPEDSMIDNADLF